MNFSFLLCVPLNGYNSFWFFLPLWKWCFSHSLPHQKKRLTGVSSFQISLFHFLHLQSYTLPKSLLLLYLMFSSSKIVTMNKEKSSFISFNLNRTGNLMTSNPGCSHLSMFSYTARINNFRTSLQQIFKLFNFPNPFGSLICQIGINKSQPWIPMKTKHWKTTGLTAMLPIKRVFDGMYLIIKNRKHDRKYKNCIFPNILSWSIGWKEMREICAIKFACYELVLALRWVVYLLSTASWCYSE